MRSLVVLLLLPLLARAEDKPNTLTQKEIDEGWILLFDGETTFGWKVTGDVKIDAGVLRIGPKQGGKLETTSVFPKSTVRMEASNDGTKWEKIKASSGGKPVTIDNATDSPRYVRSINLRPVEATPLFNAKDLTGWKVFDDPKRNQSKWSVTKEGWLNVKNGPGDLQTDGKYQDFVLQLECLSNGTALNSGVFFRCIANEFQNGYEMQVQNGYKDNDRTKPADFGTGAIYRRVPARKVVPNDKEWFAMTLVAHGNHIATWVNGYQTVDWTDDRPADDNPRKGSKTGAGHLSIQGHDPTTDLSFRNLRIVELKSDKK